MKDISYMIHGMKIEFYRMLKFLYKSKNILTFGAEVPLVMNSTKRIQEEDVNPNGLRK